MDNAAYKVSWVNRETDFEVHLKKLYTHRQFADVLLYCEGQVLRAHRFVLDFGSAHFKNMLQTGGKFWQTKDQPMFYMHNVRLQTLRSVLQFMYTGEVTVSSDRFPHFMRLCKSLGVRGLSNVAQTDETLPTPSVLPSSWSEPQTLPPAFIPIVEMEEEDSSHFDVSADQKPLDITASTSGTGSLSIENDNFIVGDIDKDLSEGAVTRMTNEPDAMINFLEEQSQASSLSGVSISSVPDDSFLCVKTEVSEDSFSEDVIAEEDPFKDVAHNPDPIATKRFRQQKVNVCTQGGAESKDSASPTAQKSIRSSMNDIQRASKSMRITSRKSAELRTRKTQLRRVPPKPSTSTTSRTTTPEANRIDVNNPIAVYCQDCNQRIIGRPELHMAKHHKGQPGNVRHECTLCQETFKQHFTAISHFRFVHNQQRTKYKCSKCGAEFAEVTTAARHKQHCHPVGK